MHHNSGGSSSSSGGGWVTAKDIDFAAEPNTPLAADGNYVISGVTFTKINTANEAAAMALVNGSGLVIQPTNPCDYAAATRSLPALFAPLANFIPTFNMSTPLRVWYYLRAATLGTLADVAVVSVEKGVAPFYMYGGGRIFNAGVKARFFPTYNAATRAEILYPAYAASDVFMLELSNGPAGWEYKEFVGTWAAGWPAFSSMQIIGFAQPDLTVVNDVTPMGVAANWNVLMGCQKLNAGAGVSATFSQLRVQYKA